MRRMALRSVSALIELSLHDPRSRLNSERDIALAVFPKGQTGNSCTRGTTLPDGRSVCLDPGDCGTSTFGDTDDGGGVGWGGQGHAE